MTAQLRLTPLHRVRVGTGIGDASPVLSMSRPSIGFGTVAIFGPNSQPALAGVPLHMALSSSQPVEGASMSEGCEPGRGAHHTQPSVSSGILGTTPGETCRPRGVWRGICSHSEVQPHLQLNVGRGERREPPPGGYQIWTQISPSIPDVYAGGTERSPGIPMTGSSDSATQLHTRIFRSLVGVVGRE